MDSNLQDARRSSMGGSDAERASTWQSTQAIDQKTY